MQNIKLFKIASEVIQKTWTKTVIPDIYPSSFTDVHFRTKIEFSNVLFHEKRFAKLM